MPYAQSLPRTVWLLLITPDAEPLVGDWRAEHDSAARYGIPAHVTVRSPFLPSELWADPTLSRLEKFLPMPLTLARLEDRPGALVIVVEPDDRLRELTDATTRAWPTLPPHKADRRTFAYHVTVVRTLDSRIRSNAAEAIAPHLPVRVTGTEMWAAAESPENGLRHTVVARMHLADRS
jgi:2'-5' RNA ligase